MREYFLKNASPFVECYNKFYGSLCKRCRKLYFFKQVLYNKQNIFTFCLTE